MINIKVIDRFQEEAGEWAKKTFPNATLESRFNHMIDEMGEVQDKPQDAMEWADVYLLFQQAALAEGFTMTAIFSAARRKQDINERRKWGKPNKDGFSEHVPQLNVRDDQCAKNAHCYNTDVHDDDRISDFDYRAEHDGK